MVSQIDLSEFDPYSPTGFGSSSNRTSQPRPSTSTATYGGSNTQSTSQDPLSLFSQLELGDGSNSVETTRNGNSFNAPSFQSADPVRAQEERHSKILSDLSREPFHHAPPLPPPVPLPIPSTSTSSQGVRPHPTRSQSGFSPPRRLSSLMDLGDQTYPQFPHQFSPPMSSSPTLEPFHSAHSETTSASRRMRQASGGGGEDWTKGLEDAIGTRQPKMRERTISADWGDFQTATPPTPGTTSSLSPSSTPEPLPPPVPSVSARTSKPSARRSTTTPHASSTRNHPPKLPTSASSLSSYHLKNLPPPPTSSTSFDPFNQPVKLSGLKPGISQILSETIAEGLRPSLPPRVRISPEWNLLYSLDQHGTSILTLFSQVSNGLEKRSGGGFVLVVRTEKGEVFGGYVSEAFKMDNETGPGSRTGSSRNGLSSLLTGNKVWAGDGSSYVLSFYTLCTIYLSILMS